MRTVIIVAAVTSLAACGERVKGPPPCELSKGVCAGKPRALVDGGYEPVCTARSYGPDYEQSETRCDGLDNDCDGLIDEPARIVIGPTRWSYYRLEATRTDAGVLVTTTFGPIYLVDGSGLQTLGSHPLDLPTVGWGVWGPEFTRIDGQLVLASFAAGAESFVWLTPVDETGAPATGVTWLPARIDPPDSGFTASHVATRGDSTITSIWSFTPSGDYRSHSVWAVTTQVDGGSTPATLLYDYDAGEAASVGATRPIALDDGTFAIAGTFASNDYSQQWFRLSHLALDFSRVDPDREFRGGRYSPNLVSGVADQNGLEGVALLVRADDRLLVVRAPFDGGAPSEWGATPDGGFMTALMAVGTSAGLRAAWTNTEFLEQTRSTYWTATAPSDARLLGDASNPPSLDTSDSVHALAVIQLDDHAEATFVLVPNEPDAGVGELVELRSCASRP